MQLSELVKYAKEKFHITENFDLTHSPDYSVLVHPKTHRWIALLMYKIERCDLRYRPTCFLPYNGEYLFNPYIIAGKGWIGINFNINTNEQVVFNLFDESIEYENENINILFDNSNDVEDASEETIEPHSKICIIREMQLLYDDDYAPFVFDICSKTDYCFNYALTMFKSKNFYRQGKFMENYVDDVLWKTNFNKQYPTYHDMNLIQLREYFSWRTKIRNGIFEKISVSYAYVYVFELLNSIGTHSIADTFNKLTDFEQKYANTKLGTPGLEKNVRLWIFGFAIVNGFSKETAIKYASSDITESDEALEILFYYHLYDNSEIISAIETIIGKNINSIVIKKYGDVGIYCFAKIWKICFDKIKESIFGKMYSSNFNPFPNVPYWLQEKHQNCIYELNKVHTYSCKNGLWTETCYMLDWRNQSKLSSFIHAADLKLRLLLQTGSYLKENEEDITYFPYVDDAIKTIVNEPKLAQICTKIDITRKNSTASHNNILIENVITKEINEMQQLYCNNYDVAKNFYIQGKFMENYTDNASLKKSLKTNYPTYHDLDVVQLRQYFSWRTKIRNGVYEKISAPFARLYVFELLNLIGTHSIEDSFNRLIDFYDKYVITFGSLGLENDMKEWILGFVVINNLPKEIALKYVPDNILMLEILMESDNQDDNAILSALEKIIGEKILSIVIKKEGQNCIHFFAEIWKKCFKNIREIIFGNNMATMFYDPFPHVPYSSQSIQTNKFYVLTDTHSFRFESGYWTQTGYFLPCASQFKLEDFVHAVDLKLRLYFNTGSYLKERRSDLQFFPFIDEAIEIIKEDLKPKVAINIASLDKIRKDAWDTRDNLLTEEDLAEDIVPSHGVHVETQNDTQIEMQVLITLLNGENVDEMIRSKRLMPSIIAERINEMFYDDFADNIVEYDDIKLSIVDDYKDDLQNLINSSKYSHRIL